MNDIDKLWAIEQIKQLKARYFRSMDTKDWAALEAVFAPDAVMDMRSEMRDGRDDSEPEMERRSLFSSPRPKRMPADTRFWKLPGLDWLIRAHQLLSLPIVGPPRVSRWSCERGVYENSTFVLQQAEALAKRVEAESTPEARVRQLYRLVFGRAPSAPEIQLGREFAGTLPQYAQVLLGSNEFLFVD